MTTTDLRNRLLAQKTFHEKVIELNFGSAETPDLVKVLIRSPTVEQRNAMFGDVDAGQGQTVRSSRITKMAARSIISCALNPDTCKPVFEETDEDLLCSMPANSWVDELSSAIMTLGEQSESAAKK